MEKLMYKKIYFIGIKGVGMASLAVIARQAGYQVQGSDVSDKFITDEMLGRQNIHIDSGFESSDIDSFVESDFKKTLIIVTAAHGGLGNPQAVYAKEKNIDVLTFGQALGMFQFGTLLSRQDISGISVAGSHGKTTTTAMVATVLSDSGDDPTFLIGTSDVGSLGDAGHYGTGKYFIVESDEYISDLEYDRVPKFHYQHPQAAIITNIDFDHPDVFDSVEDVYQAFRTFIQNIQQDGVLVVSPEDSSFIHIKDSIRDDIRVVTFGFEEGVDFRAYDIEHSEQGISYYVQYKGSDLGSVSLPVIGVHNVKNSLSVIALLHTLGKSFEDIVKGLSKFTGTKRRLEIKGTAEGGQLVIDDYAHHPTEIYATLDALMHAYPQKKIVCIFQPHTYSRTKALVNEFAQSLAKAHKLLLLPIFTSAREGKMEEFQQNELYEVILDKSHGIFLQTHDNVVEYCTQNFSSGDYLYVTMGAGDVYKISEKLIAKN
jgi:UDP-N-acetylmuramate--alanine ligase